MRCMVSSAEVARFWQEGHVLWGSQETAVEEAGVLGSVGLQMR